MKKKKLFSIGIVLLLGLSQIFAQKSSPPLTLKSGDWFQTAIQITNASNTFRNEFDIRYEITDRPAKGNMLVKVTVQRMKLKFADGKGNWLGYDSYYPPYLESRRRALTKQTYLITADSQGKIGKIQSSSPPHKIMFSLLSPKMKLPRPKAERSSDSVLATAHLTAISEKMIESLISGKALPKKIDLSNSSSSEFANAVFKSASFKLPANSVIAGEIVNLTAADSVYSVSYVRGNEEIGRFGKDGSFHANILSGLNERRRWLFGQFDEYKTFSVLLAPHDTLNIKADRLDFENTLSFTGNAASKAALSKDLVTIFDNQWINESGYRSKNIQEFIAFQEKGQVDFDAVIARYAGLVPSDIINICINDFKYVQAGTKLMYMSEYQKKQPSAGRLTDFPKDFFVSIDTLPVPMSSSEGGLYYDYYLRWLHSYQQTKLGFANANQYGFFADYATAIASFDGYPLYFSLYESLKKELHKREVGSTDRLKNYYEDFLNNCGNTWFTDHVKEEWNQARLWQPGQPSPAKTLYLTDETTLDLTKFKGKPLVLILNFDNPAVLENYVDLIKKQPNNKVHFIVGRRPGTNKSTVDQIFKNLPNVTFVEFGALENSKVFYLKTKVYTFDSDFRVISSYLIDSAPDDYEVVEDMIEEAKESGVMSEDQKAQMIKTIGWSAGSILFGGLTFFLIYKARLANFKRKESLKRKIKELEIKAIRSQMNPHFMFNALNSIQSLINNQQYRSANTYLEKFSVLMRRVLNNSEKSFVSLSDELDAIRLYCELEQLRFNFQFEIAVSPAVNAELVEIPGMIIQPLVENAILHGLAQKGDEGYLYILISSDQRNLKIVVRDNGPGLKEKTDETRRGLGLELVKERLRFLSVDNHAGNLLLMSNLEENETGATAVLTIPVD